ncbi:MAG: DUF4340 domain-containing protein [Bdellovibrionota bacterium]
MARKILLLVVLFIACYMAAHFYIRYKNTVTDDVTKIGRLANCQPSDARTIKIEQFSDGKKQELFFERTDHPAAGIPAVAAMERWSWVMKAPSRGVADPTAIRRIASTLCELYDPTPVRPEEFRAELATRRLARRVEFTMDSGAASSVEFGADQDRSTVIHYKGPEGDKMVRIPDRFLEVVSLPVAEFKNMRLMRLETDNIQKAELTIDGKERFTLERSGADWNVKLNGGLIGAGSEEAAKFLNRLSTLRGIRVMAEDFSAEKCAALKARAVVKAIDLMGQEEKVRFEYGKTGGSLTACSSLGAQEFEVHHDMLPFLDVPLKSVLLKK